MDRNVLIITNDSADARDLQEVLLYTKDGPFNVEWVRHLSDGFARLEDGGIQIVLVDLSLPDSQGIDTFNRLFHAIPYIPIMTLSSFDEENMAREAVQRGSQGFLSKGYYRNALVPQALRSVIERKAVEEALFVEKERAQVTLHSIGDGVLSTDRSSNITYLNTVAEFSTGWSIREASGKPLVEVFRIIDSRTREPARNPVDLAIGQNKAVDLSADCVLMRRDGYEIAIEYSTAPIHDRSGKITGAVIVLRDVSKAHESALKAAHLAQHDFLTNLPNRMLLNDRLAQAVNVARRRGKLLAVLFLDLDRFKHINDSLGHMTGDKLLQSVAQRLLGCVRSSDTVSRQGGDEFIILISEGEHTEEAAFIAKKILVALTKSHVIDGSELLVTVSIGISIFPDDGQDAETLIKSADIAMYHAKASGRNNYQFFKQEMNARAVERQLIEENLRRALERQEFVLHYQPKVDLETNAIIGAEALIRWRHPQRGLVFPAQFIPIAEDCGVIVSIGRWVLHQTCNQIRSWLNAGLDAVPIAINISALEFRDKHFLESIRVALANTLLDSHYIELELTERALMHDMDATVAILHTLKGMGVRLVIDDFGIGYSSLSCLKRLPIDALKIDRSFVHAVATDAEDAKIVSAVISMSNSLQHRAIAEGVETLEQLAFLQKQHCREGQGNYFSMPLVADQFAQLLVSGKIP